MLGITRLDLERQLAIGHTFRIIVTFMTHVHHITAYSGDYVAHCHQLSRLVFQFHGQRADTSALNQTTVDYTVQYRHIHITATDHTYCLAALNGNLVEHSGSHTHGTCSLGNHLLLFDQSQDSRTYLVLGNSNHTIQIMTANIICQITRLLHSNTVGNSVHAVQ